MGYFKRINTERGDADLQIDVMAGLTPMRIIARVWIQPADPGVGIPEAYVEDYELLDADTEEPLLQAVVNYLLTTEGEDAIKEKINVALKEMEHNHHV